MASLLDIRSATDFNDELITIRRRVGATLETDALEPAAWYDEIKARIDEYRIRLAAKSNAEAVRTAAQEQVAIYRSPNQPVLSGNAFMSFLRNYDLALDEDERAAADVTAAEASLALAKNDLVTIAPNDVTMLFQLNDGNYTFKVVVDSRSGETSIQLTRQS